MKAPPEKAGHCSWWERWQDTIIRVNCGPPAQEDLAWSTFYLAKLSMVLAWVLVPVAIDQYWRGKWALPSLTDLLMKYLCCLLYMTGDLRTPGLCSEERTAPETIGDSTQMDGQVNPKPQHNISCRWLSIKPECWVIPGEAISLFSIKWPGKALQRKGNISADLKGI